MSRKEGEKLARISGGSALVVLCPATGKEFSIGIDVDCFNLVAGKGIVTTPICPHCKKPSTRGVSTRFVTLG